MYLPIRIGDVIHAADIFGRCDDVLSARRWNSRLYLLRMVYLAIPEMLYEWCTMYAVQVEHVIDRVTSPSDREGCCCIEPRPYKWREMDEV